MHIVANALMGIDKNDITNGVVVVPYGVKFIQRAFKNVSGVKTVILPRSIKIIGDQAFRDCKDLVEVKLPDSVELIGSYAFSNCTMLSEISMPKNLKHIENWAFKNCSSLKKIVLRDELQSIDKYAFYNCSALETIKIPRYCNIREYAFAGCTSLKDIGVLDDVIIESNAFQDCHSLESVTIDAKMPIAAKSFYNCKNLKTVTFGEKCWEISMVSFKNCRAISQIILPKSIKSIERFDLIDSFSPTIRLMIPRKNNQVKISYIMSEHPTIYETIDEKYFTLSMSLISGMQADYVFNKTGAQLAPIVANTSPEIADKIMKDFNSSKDHYAAYKVAKLYSALNSILEKKDFDEFALRSNLTYYKILINKYPHIFESMSINDFFVFLYDLGLFKMPITETHKTKRQNLVTKEINYAQIVGEWLVETLSSEEVRNLFATFIWELDNDGNKILADGFKRDFTQFIIKDSNFIRLFEINPSLISNLYNNFEAVQKSNTSNHGEQMQLALTLEKVVDYFRTNKFKGVVDDLTKSIANEIGPYFNRQETFDNAVSIMREKEFLGTPDHILGETLDESIVYQNLNKYRSEVRDAEKGLISSIIRSKTPKYTFEFLNKSSVKNLTLGKRCSCCAHLEGAGYGIMHASIVHPYCQNIVIKDTKGEEIAKSTINVNPKECYAVCNNFEVFSGIPLEDRHEIFKKFKLAISTFAKRYNELHPNAKLTEINVGMHLNDLEQYIRDECLTSIALLPAIHYSKYGDGRYTYDGDSAENQYTMWEPPELVESYDVVDTSKIEPSSHLDDGTSPYHSQNGTSLYSSQDGTSSHETLNDANLCDSLDDLTT